MCSLFLFLVKWHQSFLNYDESIDVRVILSVVRWAKDSSSSNFPKADLYWVSATDLAAVDRSNGL